MHMSRQEFRKQRLSQLVKEQHLEDAEGLFMTEEQRESLLNSFISVKLEFHDLDGLHWTQTALRKRHGVCNRPSVLPPRSTYPFAIVTTTTTTNAASSSSTTSSSSYDAEATIRASVSPLHHQGLPRTTHKKGKKRRSLGITSKRYWAQLYTGAEE